MSRQVARLLHRANAGLGMFISYSVTAYLMYKLYIVFMYKEHVQQNGNVIVVSWPIPVEQ